MEVGTEGGTKKKDLNPPCRPSGRGVGRRSDVRVTRLSPFFSFRALSYPPPSTTGRVTLSSYTDPPTRRDVD